MTSRKRIRSRAWFFTFNNPENGYRAQICKYFESENCDYVFQLERGENGTPHYQGVIRYKNPRDTWPMIDERIHWERCRNWRSAVKYCSKVNTRIDGPWTNMEMTFRETIRDPMYGITPYEWQQKVLDIIRGPVDDRKVFWFWESEGNTGKSALAKHIRMNYKCQILNGTSKDCFCALRMRLENTDIKIVIFDLSRSMENYVSYNAIEQIKNGMFFSGKYESADIIMNPPHVLIFSNFTPEINKLSIDRWEIINIRN